MTNLIKEIDDGEWTVITDEANLKRAEESGSFIKSKDTVKPEA